MTAASESRAVAPAKPSDSSGCRSRVQEEERARRSEHQRTSSEISRECGLVQGKSETRGEGHRVATLYLPPEMGSKLLWRRSAAAAGLYASGAFGILGTVVAARVFGLREFGLYATVMVATGFFQTMLDLTVEESLMKYGFRYSTAEELGPAPPVVRARAPAQARRRHARGRGAARARAVRRPDLRRRRPRLAARARVGAAARSGAGERRRNRASCCAVATTSVAGC